MSLKYRQRMMRRKAERGTVLVVATLGMLSALLIGGMCIDVSHFYMAKIELQDAADAAALAGASQLNSTSGGIKLAVAEATKLLNKYDIKQDVAIPSSAVTFAVNLNGTYMSQASAEASPASIRFLKITIPPKPVAVSLSATVLGDTQNIGASATAGMSVDLTMNKFFTAFVFTEPNGGNGTGSGCDEGGNPLIFTPGQTYTLDSKQWQSHDPHSYHILAGSGGDLILAGSIHAYGYAEGNYMVQKIDSDEDARIARIGVNARFGDYSLCPSGNATVAPPDTIVSQNISYSTYAQMQGNGVIERSDGVKNRRVITIPIVSVDDYDVNKGQVTPNRIGAFFIKNKMDVDGELDVEYIGNNLVVPVGEYTPGGTQLDGLSIAVLYR